LIARLTEGLGAWRTSNPAYETAIENKSLAEEFGANICVHKQFFC
jgi:hypothetical protein